MTTIIRSAKKKRPLNTLPDHYNDILDMTEDQLEALVKSGKMTIGQLIAAALARQAMLGKTTAAKEIADRTVGKPATVGLNKAATGLVERLLATYEPQELLDKDGLPALPGATVEPEDPYVDAEVVQVESVEKDPNAPEVD